MCGGDIVQILYEQKNRYVFCKTAKLDFLPHLHDAIEIVYLKSGSSVFLYGNEKMSLEAGDIFICFPNQIHGYENSKDIQLYLMVLQVQPYLSAYRKLLTEKLPICPYLKKGQWQSEGLEQLLELALADKNTASEEVMRGYFQAIVGKLLSWLPLQDAHMVAEDALRSVLLYISSHYTEPLSRQKIAKAVGYNESYISHMFAESLHTTLPDYIHSLRMADANRLLTQTDLSVSRIALDLGFGSLRNFNRVFLKWHGITPSQYRRK